MKVVRTITALLVSVCVMSASPALADKASSLNRQGIEAFNEGSYQESAEIFTRALTERPESPEIRFNLGTALSAAGNVQDGIQQLDLAASRFTDDSRRANAYYNAGTALMDVQDENGEALSAAIEKLKQAVMLDQDNEDSRYNLELAVRRYQGQQNQQQQQQQQKKDSDQQEQKDSENPESDPSDDEQKDDEEQQEQKEQEQEQNPTQENKERDKQPSTEQESNQEESEDRPMTPEEARRILDAMNDEEKRALSLRRMEMKRQMRLGDDW
jgi:Ca-activated chloride channel homolog